MNSEAMQKPVADEGADDADRRIADEAEPVASHNLARQPSGNEANDQGISTLAPSGNRCPRRVRKPSRRLGQIL